LDSAGVIGTEFVGDDDNAAGAVVMFPLRAARVGFVNSVVADLQGKP
jgi:hypothetical protein